MTTWSPVAMPEHYHESKLGDLHQHAHPDYPHNHMLRAVCGKDVCRNYPTHNIHATPK